MKFAVNRGRMELNYRVDDPPPLPFGALEKHPYGYPPRELRPIWVAEVNSLEEITNLIRKENIVVSICNCGYWTGESLEYPGELMFGLAIVDDWQTPPDPRDIPMEIRRE